MSPSWSSRKLRAIQAVASEENSTRLQHASDLGEQLVLKFSGNVVQHREAPRGTERLVVERHRRGIDRMHIDIGSGESRGERLCRRLIEFDRSKMSHLGMEHARGRARPWADLEQLVAQVDFTLGDLRHEEFSIASAHSALEHRSRCA